jgi:excisionase family DNA binding protein
MNNKTDLLLNEGEVAEQLSVSKATLRRRRYEHRPPRFVKIGSSVRYRQEDVDAFIDECLVEKKSGRNINVTQN